MKSNRVLANKAIVLEVSIWYTRGKVILAGLIGWVLA